MLLFQDAGSIIVVPLAFPGSGRWVGWFANVATPQDVLHLAQRRDSVDPDEATHVFARDARPRADARAHQVLAVPLGKAPAVAAAAAVAVLVAPVFVGRVSVLAARAEGRKRHSRVELKL